VKLTRSEAASGLWQRIEEHLTRRLAEKRAENDNRTKDAIETAHLRGAISELKAFLALAQTEPAPEPEADDAE
jgi:hypothetical protein